MTTIPAAVTVTAATTSRIKGKMTQDYNKKERQKCKRHSIVLYTTYDDDATTMIT